MGAIAILRSSSAAFSSAERFRRAESAEANCSPVGVCTAGTHQVVRLDGEREAAQAVRSSACRAPDSPHRAPLPRRAPDRPRRRRPARRRWLDAGHRRCPICERTSSRASSAAVTAGRTERSQSTSRPCRLVRAIRRPTRIAARAMTTARSTQPHALELEVVLADRRGRGGGVRRGRGRAGSCRRGRGKCRRGRRRGRRGHRRCGRRRHRGRRDGCRRRGRVLRGGVSRQDAEHDRRRAHGENQRG